MAFEKIAFRAGPAPEAQQTLAELTSRYEDHELGNADVIVAIGGDGFMLQTLHGTLQAGLPIYGINRGTVGFLMNTPEDNDLPRDITCSGMWHPAFRATEPACTKAAS